MQVITGKYKGKKIIIPSISTTRVTLQRAKETMFNMLPHILEKKQALDVFAGSGQLGIEALSRGVNFCFFNELNKKAGIVLKQNLASISSLQWKVEHYDYHNLITKYQNHQFNLIFLDAPYLISKEVLPYLLDFIDKNKMLAPGGYITGQAPCDMTLSTHYDNFYLKKVKVFSKLTRIWQYAQK